MKTQLFLFFLLIFFAQISQGWAQTVFDAKEVAILSRDRYVGDDSSTALVMRLVNQKGDIRRREFLRYHKKVDGRKMTLLKFDYPNDIKDTGTLNKEVFGEDDIQHLYLPAAKKLRRVSSKNQSWVGSDFSYEDIQELEIDDYHYEAVGIEEIDGFETYVYEMVPVNSGKSEYGKQIRWVRKDNHIPVKIEYYDKKMELLKVMRAKDIRQHDGAYYAWDILCENAQAHHRTELERLWVVLNTNMPDNLLSTRHLQKSIELYDQPEGMWKIWKESREQQASS